MGHYIDERADFGIIRYANCWEDADVLCASLEAAPGKRMLSIASAGDNALALIAEGCDVIAVDLSPAQLACVELRREAFRELDYDETLAFLGVTEASQREHTYQRLSGGLSSGAKGYWDANGALIAAGVIHAGKFESYFKKFRQRGSAAGAWAEHECSNSCRKSLSKPVEISTTGAGIAGGGDSCFASSSAAS